MDGAMERRRSGVRVPLDFQVALAHEDFEEAFFADSVNLSIGGLSMRAPFLPDVGERLVCRFTVPTLGEVVEAESEVVWSQDAGSQSGEFGLRFISLDAAAEAAIAQIIASENAYIPPTPAKRQSSAPGETISLILDGVSAPIHGTIVQKDADGLTLEQPLPFLRLSTGVTIETSGRRGIVQSVDLIVEGDTPRLVVDVAYVSAESVDSDASYEDPSEGDEDEPRIIYGNGQSNRPPSMETEAASDELNFRSEDTIPDTAVPYVAPQAARRSDPTELIYTKAAAHSVMDSHDDEDADIVASMKRGNKQLEAAMARVQPVATWLAEKLRVLMAHLWVALKRFGIKAGPVLRDASHTAMVAGGRAGNKIGETAQQFMQKRARRRTTTEPSFDSNVVAKKKSTSREAVAIRPNRRRGMIVGGVAASLAIVGLAYALWPSSEPEAPVVAAAEPAPEAVDPTLNGDHQVDPLPAELAPPQEPSTVAVAGQPAVIPLDSLPTPSATRAAGPMAEPTFPTPRSNVVANATALTASMAAAMPSSSIEEGITEPSVTTGSARFGSASVPGGRVFRLRMSRPIETLTGTSDSTGFTVIIPNSLSLDRAGPIAQAHSDVAQATILNRGDHSELAIKFDAGKTPRFRVAAVGSELEIVIGTH